MSRLVEIPNVSQPTDEPPRRWFVSHDLELVVWCDQDRNPIAFQLCYDRGRDERAVTWQPSLGFSHAAVDDGERLGGKYKAIPILTPSNPVPVNQVIHRFAEQSSGVPQPIASFVLAKLQQHPDYSLRT